MNGPLVTIEIKQLELMIPRGRHYVIFRVTGCSSREAGSLYSNLFRTSLRKKNLYQTLTDFANKNFTAFLHLKGKFILNIEGRQNIGLEDSHTIPCRRVLFCKIQATQHSWLSSLSLAAL